MFLPPASYGPKNWNEATGEDRYRRALYTFRYRSVPYPMLQNFDAPNGDTSCVRRARSNTPLQALTTLNEPLFLESARALALRTLAGGRQDRHGPRLTYAFRRCLARKPTRREIAELLVVARKTERRASPNGWVSLGSCRPSIRHEPPDIPKSATPSNWLPGRRVARVLLNLDETITKE